MIIILLSKVYPFKKKNRQLIKEIHEKLIFNKTCKSASNGFFLIIFKLEIRFFIELIFYTSNSLNLIILFDIEIENIAQYESKKDKCTYTYILLTNINFKLI